MTDLRFAVMPGKLLGRERVLSVRLRVVRISSLFVEGVDDQRAVDPDGGIAIPLVEREAPAEAPGAAMIDVPCLGVGPDGHHFGRRLRLVVAREPGRRLDHVELCAAGRRPEESQGHKSDVRKAKGRRHHASFHLSVQLVGVTSAEGMNRSS